MTSAVRNALGEALAIAQGLQDAAIACGPEQTALAARLLQGASCIRAMYSLLVRAHIDRQPAPRVTDSDAREQASKAAARERLREYENGDWS